MVALSLCSAAPEDKGKGTVGDMSSDVKDWSMVDGASDEEEEEEEGKVLWYCRKQVKGIITTTAA